MNFKCTCRMVYGDIGPVGKTRSKSCEMHGSVEATAKYRAELNSMADQREACPDCLASPCDCNDPVWNFRVRRQYSGEEEWAIVSSGADGLPRQERVAMRARDITQCIGWDLGPVQRITEPPYEFPEARGSSEDALRVHSEIQASRFPRLPRPVGCQPMYITDDATVSLDDAGGTRPIAGYFAGTNEDGTVDVVVGDARFKFCCDDSAPEPDLTTLPAPQKILYKELPTGPSRANALADRCQTLEDEKRGLEVENSRLRREVERLGRKR